MFGDSRSRCGSRTGFEFFRTSRRCKSQTPLRLSPFRRGLFPYTQHGLRVAAEAVFGFSVMGLGSLLILSLLVIIEPSVELNLPSLYIAVFFIACARLKAYTSELSGALKPG